MSTRPYKLKPGEVLCWKVTRRKSNHSNCAHGAYRVYYRKDRFVRSRAADAPQLFVFLDKNRAESWGGNWGRIWRAVAKDKMHWPNSSVSNKLGLAVAEGSSFFKQVKLLELIKQF